MKRNFQNQKGATSVLIVTFILSIILLVSLSAATIMLAEIKMSRQLTDSIPAFYAADSGAERCLYQARCADLGPLATDECKDEVGNSLNQFCAKKTNGDQITSATESLTFVNSSAYVAQRDLEERVWSSGNYKGTERSVEIEWDDLPPCVPQCDGKACGSDDECGGVCPATCNTLPGCYSNNPNPAGNVVADPTKTCCQNKTCYTCPAGFIWDSGSCKRDCGGVYNNNDGYCWYLAGWGQTCTAACSINNRGGVNPLFAASGSGSSLCGNTIEELTGIPNPPCENTTTEGNFYPAWGPMVAPQKLFFKWAPYLTNINEVSPNFRKACACVR